MAKKLAWTALVVIVGAAAYYGWNAKRELPLPPPSARQEVPVPVPVPSPPPAAVASKDYPIQAPSIRLPALDDSDHEVAKALARGMGTKSLPALFYPDKIIRRFVATIDNLLLKQAPVRMMPVTPAKGPFVVRDAGMEYAIDPANSERYKVYVAAMQMVNVPTLVAFYVRFYPLFQQAYRELGYPKGNFNNRFIELLDDLLATPDAPSPVRLVQRKVLYEYADSDLEARSAGQKIIIRMGRENAIQVKALLRAVRSEVIRHVAVK